MSNVTHIAEQRWKPEQRKRLRKTTTAIASPYLHALWRQRRNPTSDTHPGAHGRQTAGQHY